MNRTRQIKITQTKMPKLNLRNVTFINVIKMKINNLYIAAYKSNTTSSDIVNHQSLHAI